jgi:hypothetical protein
MLKIFKIAKPIFVECVVVRIVCAVCLTLKKHCILPTTVLWCCNFFYVSCDCGTQDKWLILVTDTCVCLGVGVKFFHIIYLNVCCITSRFLPRPDYLHATCTWYKMACLREKRHAYSFLIGKPEGQRPLGRPRYVRRCIQKFPD